MGQYYRGNKIGTCENMYWLRLEDAVKLAGRGDRDDDKILFKDYINDGATRFRFPFPDEDHMTMGEIYNQKYDKAFSLPAAGITVSHSDICVHNEHHSGGHGVNIFLPCPHSEQFNLKTSTGGPGEQFLDVRFEAIREMEVKTIFACARCGQEQRFSSEDIVKIKARGLEYFESYNKIGKNDSFDGNQGLYDYAKEIINRLK